MTTIKLSGGDLGDETMLVRCNLAEASAPVEVDYQTGDGWEGTQYQCADTHHRTNGLIAIGKMLAAKAVEVHPDEFACLAERVEPTYTVSDAGSNDSGLTYAEAVERIAEWYEDADEWGDGEGDEAVHDAIRAAIDTVPQPQESGDLSDLSDYAEAIRQSVAEACGSRSFAGHGNYHVSAADQGGFGLTVQLDD